MCTGIPSLTVSRLGCSCEHERVLDITGFQIIARSIVSLNGQVAVYKTPFLHNTNLNPIIINL